MTNSGEKIKGIYVAPRAIINNPDYGRRLAHEFGINLFILRCGFDPMMPDPMLGEAVEIISNMGLPYWLLAGTWWGQTSLPKEEEMIPIIRKDFFPEVQSFEAQFPMKGLGGATDDIIAEYLEQLCNRYSPGGICLTHSRYRSPAYLAGLFEYSKGSFEKMMHDNNITPAILSDAFSNAVNRLSAASSKELIELSKNSSMECFLDVLSQSQLFSEWFTLREKVLSESIVRLRATVKASQSGEILFGSNVFDPFSAHLCGQNYDKMKSLYDFIQPLLGYMLWHIYEPVAAWSKLLLNCSSRLTPAQSVEITSNLLNLDNMGLSRCPDCLINSDEGRPQVIENVVNRAIKNCLQHLDKGFHITPVLRGRDWPTELSLSFANKINSQGFDGVIFQGTQIFTGNPPGDGWY